MAKNSSQMKQKFLSQEHPANLSPLTAVKEDWMKQMESSLLNLLNSQEKLNLGGLFGRTSPEFYPVTKDKIFTQSLEYVGRHRVWVGLENVGWEKLWTPPKTFESVSYRLSWRLATCRRSVI